LIIQICRSHNTFYIYSVQTKSMLILITQQLMSIDLARPHIQIAMGNVSLPVHLRTFCNETKLIIVSNTFKWPYIKLIQIAQEHRAGGWKIFSINNHVDFAKYAPRVAMPVQHELRRLFHVMNIQTHRNSTQKALF